jgi:murein DD-endopeptidase MepM/ murein hydrolase activator NlpD
MPFLHPWFGAPRGRIAGIASVALVLAMSSGGAAAGVSDPDGRTEQAAALDADVAASLPYAIARQRADAYAKRIEAQVRRHRAGIICPVAGIVWFYDDFGNPRSGGRRHEGNDLMSAGGVHVVAVVDGAVTFKSGSRQGTGAYLRGDDGNEYWYFHLDEYAGEPRLVRRGEVIGVVGESGNAGGVHTHFEIHPGWDPDDAENPYPKIDLVCTDRVPMR